VCQIEANKKILKVTKFGPHNLKTFFNFKQFIGSGSGVNLTPTSRRRVKTDAVLAILVVLCITRYHGNWLLAAAADEYDGDGGLIFSDRCVFSYL